MARHLQQRHGSGGLAGGVGPPFAVDAYHCPRPSAVLLLSRSLCSVSPPSFSLLLPTLPAAVVFRSCSCHRVSSTASSSTPRARAIGMVLHDGHAATEVRQPQELIDAGGAATTILLGVESRGSEHRLRGHFCRRRRVPVASWQVRRRRMAPACQDTRGEWLMQHAGKLWLRREAKSADILRR